MIKKILAAACLFLTLTTTLSAQSTLDGVYVGAKLYLTPYNGMQIDYIVYYFHPNKTFNDQMNVADWRTRVSGNYSIANGMVSLKFNKDGDDKKYKLAANGKLESTAGIKHILQKVTKATSVPAGTYERKSASTSGGMGTNMPMVGAFSSNYLTFDGKGNFSSKKQSVVGVSGDGIAGKSERNGQTEGTYKLGDGEIILTYSNGKATKHTFFYSPPDQQDLILVDGEFYFRDDEKKKTASKTRTTNKSETRSAPTEAGSTNNVPSAATLLAKMRAQYGGDNIDKLSTIKETATMTGNMQITNLIDIANKRARAEISKNGKLLMVKQLEGATGWQWIPGNKKPLSAAEITELELGFYQGVLGLHKKLNNYLAGGTVTDSKGNYMVTFSKDNNKIIYLVGTDLSLKGNAYTVGSGKPSIAVYKNFRQSNGISYPATTEFTDGTNKLVTNTTNIEFNPALPAETWSVPDGQ